MQSIFKEIISLENLNKSRSILFNIMLTIEIFIVFLDKSDYHFGYESYVFRVTFLISCIIILMGMREYDIREWIMSFVLLSIAIISYKSSGRNEMLRFLAFIMACKGLDLRNKLKIFFYENLIGFGLLIALSVSGIYGRIMEQHTDGSMLYVFGFGNANAFHCMFMMILLLGLYIYSDSLKWYHYLILFFINAVVYSLTSCEAAFAISALGIIGMFLQGVKIRDKSIIDCGFVYIAGIAAFAFSIAFSVWAAIVSKDAWWSQPIANVDRILTGRIKNLYWNWNAHPGAIESWRLISGRDTEYYFDMGWCRLFYWYGIIPSLCVIVLILVLYIRCMKQRDGYLLVMLACISVYTIVEAHVVSVYIGRNYILLFLGACIYSLFDRKDGEKIR